MLAAFFLLSLTAGSDLTWVSFMSILINLCIRYLPGLPESPDIDELKTVLERTSKHQQIHAITLLSALLRNIDEALALHARLKLSAFERDLAQFIVNNRGLKPNTTHPLLPFQKLAINSRVKLSDTRFYIEQIIKYNDFPFLMEFRNWVMPRFPVSGTHLVDAGVRPGRPMGRVMDQLKSRWAESNFTLTHEDLIRAVPDVINDLEIQFPNKQQK